MPEINIDLKVFFVFDRLSIVFVIGPVKDLGTDLNSREDHAIVDCYEIYWLSGSGWDFFGDVGLGEYFQKDAFLRSSGLHEEILLI